MSDLVAGEADREFLVLEILGRDFFSSAGGEICLGRESGEGGEVGEGSIESPRLWLTSVLSSLPPSFCPWPGLVS